MALDELLDIVNKEIAINPNSFDHAVGCWTRFIDKYPENKEAIIAFCYESIFGTEYIAPHYSIIKPSPIIIHQSNIEVKNKLSIKCQTHG